MLRFTFTFAIAVLGAAALGGVSVGTQVSELMASRAAAEQTSFRGQIVVVERDALVVSVAGQQVRFLVADDARIRLDGIAATLADLQPRFAVSILAETQGTEPIAKDIDAATRM